MADRAKAAQVPCYRGSSAEGSILDESLESKGALGGTGEHVEQKGARKVVVQRQTETKARKQHFEVLDTAIAVEPERESGLRRS